MPTNVLKTTLPAERLMPVLSIPRQWLGQILQITVRPEATKPRRSLHDVSKKFWAGPSLKQLAKRQGVKPMRTLEEAYGDFWQSEDSVDDFIATVRQWRKESVLP